jgi:hypothetical protein
MKVFFSSEAPESFTEEAEPSGLAFASTRRFPNGAQSSLGAPAKRQPRCFRHRQSDQRAGNAVKLARATWSPAEFCIYFR